MMLPMDLLIVVVVVFVVIELTRIESYYDTTKAASIRSSPVPSIVNDNEAIVRFVSDLSIYEISNPEKLTTPL